MVENGNASIVRDCWLDLPYHYPHVSLDAFVVMPDHVHGIIVLLDTYGAGLKPAPYNPNRSNVLRTEPRYPPPKK
jgi:putative transposase